MSPNVFAAYKIAVSKSDNVAARRLLGQLITEETPRIARHARKLAKGDMEDLMQAGRVELAVVIGKYDPSRGSFSAFVNRKIVDAMHRQVVAVRQDVVSTGNRWNPMPRAVRRKAEAFIAKHGRQATAEELGVDAADLAAWRETGGHFMPYVEEGDARDSTPHGLAGVLAAATRDVHNCVSKALREAIGGLSDRERRILIARAIDGEEFGVIAADEGVSRQYTTRVYLECVAKLRLALGA